MSSTLRNALAAAAFLAAPASALAAQGSLVETCAARAESDQLACYKAAAENLQAQVDFFTETPFARPEKPGDKADSYPADAVRAYLNALASELSLNVIGYSPQRLVMGLESSIRDGRRGALAAAQAPAPAPMPQMPMQGQQMQAPMQAPVMMPASYATYGMGPAAESMQAPMQYAPAPQAQQQYAPMPMQQFAPARQGQFAPAPQEGFMPQQAQQYAPAPQAQYAPAPQQQAGYAVPPYAAPAQQQMPQQAQAPQQQPAQQSPVREYAPSGIGYIPLR